MKKSILALAVVVAFAPSLFAQGTPSSKATAAINTAVGCTVASSSDIGDTLPQTCHDVFSGASVPVSADNYADIMTSTIKVSNSQSLFVSPSLVTGLYTQTKTKTSPGTSSTASGEGAVVVRAVLKDASGNVVAVGQPASSCSAGVLGCSNAAGPWGVLFDQRTQTLTQSISNCVVTVGTLSGSCTFDLTTDLILKTTSAHTFNFIFPNVGVGTYNVVIQAAVDAAASATGGTAVGAAAYGLGSLTVESVRLVHDFSF